MTIRRVQLLIVGAILMSASVYANPYIAGMSGGNEVPANASPATGLTTVSILGDVMSVEVSWSGLTGGLPAAAHIHCCIAAGASIGVAVGFPGFPATLSGTYSHTFDLMDPAIYTAGSRNNFGGGTAAGAEAALIAGLDAGWAYSNIHNEVYPGGEIRGLLGAVPEPSSILLVSAGIAGLGLARRKRSTCG